MFDTSSRRSRWWAGWRVAVRLARRDVRRHRVRSALIAVMVGLPVLLLTAGTTLIATNDVNPVESIPRLMGDAAVRVSVSSGTTAVAQDAISTNTTTLSDHPSASLPGHAVGASWTASDVTRLLGGRAIPVSSSSFVVQAGTRRIRADLLGVDGRDPVTRPMAQLVSGRWAQRPDEVTVTPAGISHGLPRSGHVVVLADATGRTSPLTLSVVGVADGLEAQGKPDLVGQTALADPTGQATDFLVDRAAPVTWTDVRRLNTYGLTAQSRWVFEHPPSPGQLDPQVRSQDSGSWGGGLVLVLIGLGIFIETTLLAGPAFAVSAARQRHSLALAASNGAEARQLRRSVLGQALVLGVLSALASVGLGLVLARVGILAWTAHDPAFDVGPFDVPWLQVLGILGCAVVAAIVSALLPARGIARLDIVAVLNGRAGAGRARRGLPVVGVLVMIASAVACIGGVAAGGREILVVAGAFGLVVGCLMVIPVVLAAVGHLGSRFVLPLRLATRDSARQRGRSTPAVAAIMAAVAGLTALSIGLASDTTQARRDYQMRVPMGQGQISADPVSITAIEATVRRVAPSLAVQAMDQVGVVSGPTPTGGAIQVVAAVPAGCSPARSLSQDGDSDCTKLGTNAYGSRGVIGVLSSSAAARAMALTAAQRKALDQGRILVADPSLVSAGRVRFAVGTQKQSDGNQPPAVVTGQRSLRAEVVPEAAWRAAFPQSGWGALVSPATAQSLHWHYGASTLTLTSPTGSISEATEQKINDQMDPDSELYVERGYQRADALVMALLFGVAGLLVLIAALISTALSLAESQADMSTLAAVGATRRTRRGFAAGQALVVSVVGCGLGVLVGLVPGIAVTWPLTSGRYDSIRQITVPSPPTITIPYWQLLAVAVGVPILAAVASAIAVRRAPTMVRRLG